MMTLLSAASPLLMGTDAFVSLVIIAASGGLVGAGHKCGQNARKASD
jgi:hypothetical protein